MNKVLQNIVFCAVALVVLNACGAYKTVKNTDCIAGVSHRTLTFSLNQLDQQSDDESYSKLKRAIQSEGYYSKATTDSNKCLKVFKHSVDTFPVLIYLITNSENDYKLKFWDTDPSRKPSKFAFNQHCRKAHKRIKASYFAKLQSN